LLSITRMLKQGWKLVGDRKLGGENKKMWLTKDGNTLVFDVGVNTNKGMLFCICIKRPIGTGELIVNPVNVEVQDGKAREGVDIQLDAPNKQESEPDGNDNNVQDGGIASGTDSESEGNDGDGFTTITRSGHSMRSPQRLIEEIGGTGIFT
jgi:hypothetical protein